MSSICVPYGFIRVQFLICSKQSANVSKQELQFKIPLNNNYCNDKNSLNRNCDEILRFSFKHQDATAQK